MHGKSTRRTNRLRFQQIVIRYNMYTNLFRRDFCILLVPITLCTAYYIATVTASGVKRAVVARYVAGKKMRRKTIRGDICILERLHHQAAKMSTVFFNTVLYLRVLTSHNKHGI